MIELGAHGVTREEYLLIVREHTPVAIDTRTLDHLATIRARMLAHIGAGKPAYGVTTGLGILASVAVGADDQRELQRSLLTARAAGLGPPLPAEVVRGTMLLRLTGFLQGAAGVTPELCRFLAARLNDGWAPLVPNGPYGAAGEIGPLAHLFQTFIGEGTVQVDGTELPAAEALRRGEIVAYDPKPKEGLALINGSPFATALGLMLADRARHLLHAATAAAALATAVTASGTQAASPRVGSLTGDVFAEQVQRDLAVLLAAEDVWTERTQPPVSTRVLPQVHGAALRSLSGLEETLESRLGGTTDSPLYLEAAAGEARGLYPSGAFHAIEVVLALESVALACCHVVNLIEKRLHRLLDTRFSKLPEQLTEHPGVEAGVVSLHKGVVGLTAAARSLAVPSSLHALDGSSGQEDVQSFTFLAAARLAELLDAFEAAVAYELVALRQAAHLASSRPRGELLLALVAVLAAAVPPVDRDRTLSADVQRVRKLVASGAFASPTSARAIPGGESR